MPVFLSVVGKLIPVSTGVNGSTPLNRASVIEVRRVLNASLHLLFYFISNEIYSLN